MVAVDRISGEKFAQPGGAKIGAFGIKILRRCWGIYRQSFVQKEAQIREKTAKKSERKSGQRTRRRADFLAGGW
jgi:hypothetical protein